MKAFVILRALRGSCFPFHCEAGCDRRSRLLAKRGGIRWRAIVTSCTRARILWLRKGQPAAHGNEDGAPQPVRIRCRFW